MSYFPDFDKIRAQVRKDGEAARMAADDGVSPEVGGTYTVSPDFITGDRSWTDCFWHIIARSGPNLLVQIHDSFTAPPARLFREDERAWYPAGDAFAAFQATERQAEETKVPK